MTSPPDFQEERAALEAVIDSGIFRRAPNMARILGYVCAKYFEGKQAHLKEYTIAVEALGRPVDFNHERDSIVRVEVHRLRKRLLDFYRGDGASHPIRIVLPVGQYAPLFVRHNLEERPEQPEPPDAAEQSAIPSESQIPQELESEDILYGAPGIDDSAEADEPVEVAVHPDVSRGAEVSRRGWNQLKVRLWPARRLWILIAILMIGLIGLIPILVNNLNSNPGPKPGRVEAQTVTAEQPPGVEMRILAGWTNGPYTDHAGRIWQPDRFATGGYAMDYRGHVVDGAFDPRIYESSREGDFQYDIPLATGSYELRLHFAEMIFGGRNVGAGGEGSRIFDVDANGRRLLSRFDIISDAAGANIADERVFKEISPGSDGQLHLRFTHMIRDPLLNAIEIRPSEPGKMRPVRIVTSEHPFIDQAGSQWEADRYYRGGQLIARPHPVSGTPDPGLYRHARCGNITYAIPVAPESSYTVILRFAEGWIGTGNPVGGGVGSRLFNILCNGQTLARGFDIFREAGGAERAVEKRYRGLLPDPQGKLVIHFQPVESYACINAIEVLDEGR